MFRISIIIFQYYILHLYIEFGENRLKNDTTVVKNARFGPFFMVFAPLFQLILTKLGMAISTKN
jgi:hypothetical protein